jgi:hypothetical protein
MLGFLLMVCFGGTDGVLVNFNYVGLMAPIPLIDGFEVPWGSTRDKRRINLERDPGIRGSR